VDPEGLGCPEDRSEIARVLDMVEHQVKRRLAAREGLGQEVLDVDVLGRT